MNRAACLLWIFLAGCDEWEPMQVQERPNVYRSSEVFEDGRVMRPAVPDTISQEAWSRHAGLPTDQNPDSGFVDALPLPLTRELLVEGQQRFEITCATCHGLTANGQSIVGSKMSLRSPPSLLVPRESGRTLSAGELPRPLGFYFAVMSEGYGLMPSYAELLDPRQRWAVVAYLRALALSQRAPLSAAPDDVRERLSQEVR
jgi:mono/diheme cytochrome c family protein